jgi:hypothetical protein
VLDFCERGCSERHSRHYHMLNVVGSNPIPRSDDRPCYVLVRCDNAGRSW